MEGALDRTAIATLESDGSLFHFYSFRVIPSSLDREDLERAEILGLTGFSE